MELLRFLTAGSVDDGKSTLIGRLLFDSKNILVDQLETLQKQSKNKNGNDVDLALLTDGLRAEREQGITIDVAYKYFSTPHRKYIIADAPGHVQYTRNMVTAASTADAIIVLVDARVGVIEQTRRHSYISSLMGIKHVIFAINKMDLIDFDFLQFESIKNQCVALCERLGIDNPIVIPISALLGDNITSPSQNMKWYSGLNVLDTLEQLDVSSNKKDAAGCFEVQYVNRPQSHELHDFRGFMGNVKLGKVELGQELVVFPSLKKTKISRIWSGGVHVDSAHQNQVVTLELANDLDISRGDMFYQEEQTLHSVQEVEARICWFSEKPGREGMKVKLRFHSSVVRAVIQKVLDKMDIQNLTQVEGANDIKLNEIVKVSLKLQRPILLSENKNSVLNRAILVDEVSNETLASVKFYAD